MAEGGGLDSLGSLKVALELGRWRRLGYTPRLWWRDDDARAPSPALDRLLDLAGDRPLALAVIPTGDLAPLAARLRAERQITTGQHGVDHRNRRPDGAPPSEYAHEPTVSELVARIGAGRQRLTAAGLAPHFYAPPWNAVGPGLVEALSALGIPLLTAGRAPSMPASLPYLAADVDVLRWKGGARFKGAARILSRLAGALAERRAAGAFRRPVGLLTHHLDHDAATWRFLDRALPYLDRRFDWIDVASPSALTAASSPSVPLAAMAEMQHVC